MPTAIEDITAADPVDGERPEQTGIVTTLYDLIAALNDQHEPGEEDVTTAVVVHLCNTGNLRFLRVHGNCEVWSVATV
jgi:hypothetical protein